MQDLNNLRYFAGIVEQGSLTAAARALGVARSVVSEHLARLESELGLRLVHRTTRRVEVSELGLRYYEQCRAALDAVERAARVADQACGIPRGRLRVLCPLNFAQRLLMPLLCDFLAAHPMVEVRLDAGNDAVDPIVGGHDLVLRIGPTLPASGLVSRAFPLRRHWLVASPSFVARHGAVLDPAMLGSLPSITGSHGGIAGVRHLWHLQHPDGASMQVAHVPRLLSEDVVVIRDAALAGLGVAELPPLVCEADVAAGALVRLVSEWRLPAMQLHALYPSRDGLAPAARAFLDHLSGAMESLLQAANAGPPASA